MEGGLPIFRSTGTWFDSAAFGLFIHWDHARDSGGEISVPIAKGPGTVAEYHASAATFDPQNWHPARIAAAARAAGMTYGVFTTRHCNGYSMWPTRQGGRSVLDSPTEHDFVRDYVDAFRAAGLRVGLYFTLSDWGHPDYPAFTDDMRPYLNTEYPRATPEQWQRYRGYMLGSLREILSDYGEIDLLWLDGHWERSLEEWGVEEIAAVVAELQPDCIISDRLPGMPGYFTAELGMPSAPPNRKWELCTSIGKMWGYSAQDTELMSSNDVLKWLIETVAWGGNLLLNVPPMGDGALSPPQMARMNDLARWMETRRESVIGAGPGLSPWQFDGPTTRRENRVYLHLTSWPLTLLTVRGIPIGDVDRITDLATGRVLDHYVRADLHHALEGMSANPAESAVGLGEICVRLPERPTDDLVPVLAVDFKQGATVVVPGSMW